jgi:hypothetical protein
MPAGHHSAPGDERRLARPAEFATPSQLDRELTKRASRRLGSTTRPIVSLKPGAAQMRSGFLRSDGQPPQFESAEWGFAIGAAYRAPASSGMPRRRCWRSLSIRLRFTGYRLAARVTAFNGRGNRALRKAGAVVEALLPVRSCATAGISTSWLYAIVDSDWRQSVAERRRMPLATVQ